MADIRRVVAGALWEGTSTDQRYYEPVITHTHPLQYLSQLVVSEPNPLRIVLRMQTSKRLAGARCIPPSVEFAFLHQTNRPFACSVSYYNIYRLFIESSSRGRQDVLTLRCNKTQSKKITENNRWTYWLRILFSVRFQTIHKKLNSVGCLSTYHRALYPRRVLSSYVMFGIFVEYSVRNKFLIKPFRYIIISIRMFFYPDRFMQFLFVNYRGLQVAHSCPSPGNIYTTISLAVILTEISCICPTIFR
jgi:hypothetical protein